MLKIASTALLMLGLSSSLAAKPDFSGTWVLDPERSQSVLTARLSSATLIITQNDLDVRVDAIRNGVPEEVRYASATDSDTAPRAVGTSGSGAASDEPPRAVGTSGRDRTLEAVPGIIGTRRTGVSTTWKGDTMVTLTAYQVNGQTVTTTEERTLSANGREMTVVMQLQVHHGGYPTSSPLTDVYVREQS